MDNKKPLDQKLNNAVDEKAKEIVRENVFMDCTLFIRELTHYPIPEFEEIDLAYDTSKDVTSHYFVSDFLSSSLLRYNEKVVTFYGLNIWCKTSCKVLHTEDAIQSIAKIIVKAENIMEDRFLYMQEQKDMRNALKKAIILLTKKENNSPEEYNNIFINKLWEVFE